MAKLVIYGLGDFASLVGHYFETQTDHELVAYCADRDYVNVESSGGLPVVPFDEMPRRFAPAEHQLFVAVGYSRMRARVRMFDKARQAGYSFARFVHASASIDQTAVLGDNVVVFPGTVVEPFASVGDNAILWSSAVVSHHASIGKHCFVASGSVTGGFARVGENSFLGFNSTVLQGLAVGRETLVAAGAVVTGDTEDYSRMHGVPARQVGSHRESGIEID